MYTTRIAPSPTGFMHVGTARTALFNWIVARTTGGKFILRMDDTDADRNIKEAEQPIFDGLEWLGLDHDAFYRQSSREQVYIKYAALLYKAGLVVRAPNNALLLKYVPEVMPRSWKDEIGGNISISDKAVEEIDGKLVLMRGQEKGGTATYQFASIVDDFELDVNYIIRGSDHIANTSKQLCIWAAINEALPAEQRRAYPKFAHLGLIFYNKKKMSKRDGAASLLDYRDKGFDPDALFAFLSRLGWAPREDNKANSLLNRQRTLDMFLTEGSMRSSQANFDEQKLNWFNKMASRLK